MSETADNAASVGAALQIATLTRENSPGIFECAAASNLNCWYWPDCSKSQILFAGVMMQSLGYEQGDLLPDQETYNLLVHPEDRAQLTDAMTTIISEGRVGDYESEYRMRRKDGTYATVRGIMSVVRPQGTGKLAAFGVTRLIDTHKEPSLSELKLTQDALHAVLNQIGHPVVLMTAEGLILQANEAAARVVGADAASLPGSRLCPFLHESDHSTVGPPLLSDVVRTSQRQDRELRRFDRWWHIHLFPLNNNGREVRRVLLLAEDITALKAQQAEQLAREKALTFTLVREVHHRIKNHLQGLIGLLRSYSDSSLPTREVLDAAVRHILSIATVHGLLAKQGQESIEFAELVRQIIDTLRLSASVPVQFTLEAEHWQPTALSQEEAVPLAVAVGELVTNAVKHTSQGPEALVQGTLAHVDGVVELNITNSPARLPADFRVSGRARQSAGLDLVQALLPKERSELAIFQDGDKVVTRLRLKALSQPGDVQAEMHA